MKYYDVIFIIAFCIAAVTLSFSHRQSMTGWVTQTRYCEGYNCFDLCTTNSDCMISEKCCAENDFGYCTKNCKTAQYEVSFEPVPESQSPAAIRKPSYILPLLMITFFIGAIYLYIRSKEKSL